MNVRISRAEKVAGGELRTGTIGAQRWPAITATAPQIHRNTYGRTTLPLKKEKEKKE